MSARRSAVRDTALMVAAESFSMTGFAAYTTLLPLLMKEWGLNNSEAGFIGGIYYAGYMLAVPALTSLTDRIDSRRVYAAACLVSSLAALGFALLAEGLWSALVFQFLIGVGLGGTYMPGLKTLTDHIEGKGQSRSVAFYTAGFGVGSSLSIIVCGALGAAFGWQWAFVYGAVGPLVAAALVMLHMPRGRVRAAGAHPHALLDFRPVLANRKTVPYIVGYAAHNYELFGQRSWMVAFLVFCSALDAGGAAALAGAATLAAFVNLLGPPGSILGNELALRWGRSRVIFTFMTLSGLVACGLGLLAGQPLWIVFAVMCVHYALMLFDSAALTGGLVAATPPEMRGATMAVYSFIGFATAFLAPLVFGVVLDLAGGNQDRIAWTLAFASIGIFGVFAPVARAIYLRRPRA